MNGNRKWLGGVDGTQNYCVAGVVQCNAPKLNEARLKKEK
jgi:hypothetical protein